MAPCDIASFIIAREKSIGIRRLRDNESTQMPEVTEGEASGGGSATCSDDIDSGFERAPGYKPNLEWCTHGGPRGTYVEAMQRREDDANRKKRIRDGSPDCFRDGHCQMEDRLSEHRPNRRCGHCGGIPNENDCDCGNWY